MDTIFALSSGSPPAAIAVMRITGPDAGSAVKALAGSLPQPRHASLRTLAGADGQVLDRALVLWFPGPASATGEDCAELHLHGGRAVVTVVEQALATLPGLRKAEPGEFTRRAFANGRLDLAEAEGLADLLEAETELQHRAAMSAVGGVISRKVHGWRERALTLSATVESILDFSDEDDVSELPQSFREDVSALAGEIAAELDAPRAERMRDGYRVVLAGPPNAGKSSLFNALIGEDVAIALASPGTTRDVLERPVSIRGVPVVFSDTAGLRDDVADEAEGIGISKARDQLAKADLVLWLGPEGEGPTGAWEVEPKADLPDTPRKSAADVVVSARTGRGVEDLLLRIAEQAGSSLVPAQGRNAWNERQRAHLVVARGALERAEDGSDLLLVAENLRECLSACDAILGLKSTEAMLDHLFGRFCIGK
ncbi:tRNA uridine-5-carboxymethylaminomethyl(34) synthesis GTPase MnmE [Qipengyuania sp. JC766]|uniref:tRNA uridine-5-carboxymethylaminomethyl(34) synthesis GTPase MnmE n=1 Tax=Qipengyuania sp. JC766 TaxID=3232139 RepID=UPI003458A490